MRRQEIGKRFGALMLCLFTVTALCSQPVSVQAANSTAKTNQAGIEKEAAKICSTMSVDQKIGQVLLMNFRKWKSSDAADDSEPVGMTELDPEVAAIISKYHIGNIILFGENTQTTTDTATLTQDLQETAKKAGDYPLLIGIDQEGGVVTRLVQGTSLPGNMAIGATGNTDYAYEAGSIIGQELAAEGINCDFAPDSDVNDNPDNPVIGLRSFGSDPQKVANMAVSMLKGIKSENIAACGKHFPGHGNTTTDTHTGLALVEKTKSEWESVEAVPFKAIIDGGADMIMTAHIQYPGLDDTKVKSKKSGKEIYLPATLSSKILNGVLREELGFDGVICTDALDMQAITENYGETEAVVMALKAGADLLCNPVDITSADEVGRLDNVYKAIKTAVSDGTIPKSRLDDAVKRVLKLKLKYGIIDGDTNTETATTADEETKTKDAASIVGSAENRKKEREIAEAAVTLYNADAGSIKLKKNDKVLFAIPYDSDAASITFAVNRLIKEKSIPSIKTNFICYNEDTDISDSMKTALRKNNHIIIVTEVYGADLTDSEAWRTNMPLKIIEAAKKNSDASMAVISTRLPYDAANYTNIPVYITYGSRTMSQEDAESGTITGSYGPNIPAGIGAAFGAFKPTGKLPVDLMS